MTRLFPLNLKLANITQATAGYAVAVAADAAEALRRLREQRPALILMDLQMPGPVWMASN
jgi:two-component system cell cycle response regulator DivK